MPISKVEANNVKNSQKLYISEKPNLHKEPSNVDNEKSNAAKYMLGLTALAGIIAVGIIGHKNNWWGKAEEAAKDLSKKGSEALETAKNKNSNNPKDLLSGVEKHEPQPIRNDKPEVINPQVNPVPLSNPIDTVRPPKAEPKPAISQTAEDIPPAKKAKPNKSKDAADKSLNNHELADPIFVYPLADDAVDVGRSRSLVDDCDIFDANPANRRRKEDDDLDDLVATQIIIDDMGKAASKENPVSSGIGRHLASDDIRPHIDDIPPRNADFLSNEPYARNSLDDSSDFGNTDRYFSESDDFSLDNSSNSLFDDSADDMFNSSTSYSDDFDSFSISDNDDLFDDGLF